MSATQGPSSSYTCVLHEVLASTVRAGLRDLGMPQAWLADQVGMSEKHVSQMLTGKAEGSLVSWDILLGRVGRWPLPLNLVDPAKKGSRDA